MFTAALLGCPIFGKALLYLQYVRKKVQYHQLKVIRLTPKTLLQVLLHSQVQSS